MSTRSTKDTVIIAPHVDDEVIGCWSFLSSGKIDAVIYLNELTDIRRREAEACARRFDFIPFFDDIPMERVVGKTLLVPAITDSHPDHKAANKRWRLHSQVLFYSVDMNNGTKKLVTDFAAKKDALDALFPSQSSLWANNAAYYLFEDIQPLDYKVYVKTMVAVHDGSLTVEVITNGPCPHQVSTIRQLVDCLAGFSFKIICPSGVTYESWN